MSRCPIALAALVLVLVADAGSAQQLPWAYEVRFRAAGAADAIYLGSDRQPRHGDESGPLWYAMSPTGPDGLVRTDSRTDFGTQTLYRFGYGDWTLSETFPAAAADGAFDLIWRFTAANGDTADGIARGVIRADGFFSSGTGNFGVGLSQSVELTLSGQRADVLFQATKGETASRIEMTVTELPPPAETPEPATLVLAGVGLLGAGLWRKRRN